MPVPIKVVFCHISMDSASAVHFNHPISGISWWLVYELPREDKNNYLYFAKTQISLHIQPSLISLHSALNG